MLSAILRFEVRYWMRAPMVWVFFSIVLALNGSALSSGRIHVEDGLNNIYKNSHKNSPYEIENWYAITAPLTLLIIVAFVNSAAARDFALNTYQIIFTTPIRRWDFLLGRYFGASIVSLFPMLAVSAAILSFKYTPWVEAHRWGPVRWDAHAWGLIVFAIPNTLFMSAILFAVAALTRSTVTSFLAGLLFLAGYIASGRAAFESRKRDARYARLSVRGSHFCSDDEVWDCMGQEQFHSRLDRIHAVESAALARRRIRHIPPRRLGVPLQ